MYSTCVVVGRARSSALEVFWKGVWLDCQNGQPLIAVSRRYQLRRMRSGTKRNKRKRKSAICNNSRMRRLLVRESVSDRIHGI